KKSAGDGSIARVYALSLDPGQTSPKLIPMRRERRADAEAENVSVVILGAGYAGLRAALGLAREPGVVVTLIDRERAPVIKTRLHELHESARTTAVDRLLSGTDVRFVEGRISEINRARNEVHVEDGDSLRYDYLVVALGSRASDFGIPGVREHAVLLDGAKDADQLSREVDRLKRSGGRLAVVGGGPTGVEAAAEASRRLGRGRVTLIDADRRILQSFSLLPRAYARSVLAGLGVRVRSRAKVVGVEPNHLVLGDGKVLPYGALLWSAGVEAHPLLAASSLAAPHQQAPVDDFLVSLVDPDVYVVGDCADANQGEPSAQLAVQQGDFAARDLIYRLHGGSRTRYNPTVLGQFVSLGCDATGFLKLGRAEVPLFGPPARAAKAVGEARHRLVVAARAAASS
ncbi:MAG: FAD-dependent oxidoreductase, partial [Polyangiales bacterium]